MIVAVGLRALLARDAAIENWLQGEVAKSYDDYASAPDTAPYLPNRL
jgi:hypothetical protein